MQIEVKFSNKRGTLTLEKILMHLGMIVLALSVILLLKYAKDIEKNTEFQKIFLSRDLALLINTLYSVPADVTYNYNFNKLDLSNFRFQFKPFRADDDKPVVIVEDNSIKKIYPYANPSQATYIPSIYGKNSIKFFKSDLEISIENE